MIEVFPLTSNLLEEIIHVADRNSLDFPEYNFLSDEELKAYFHSTLSNNLTDIKGSYTLVAVECNSPLGLININKNDFDSQFFDFPCYQLHLYIFSRKDREIEKIISLLIKNAESKVRNESDIFHFSIGLNNNSVNNQQLFNCLIQNGFYFVNTLLTFTLQEKKSIEKKPKSEDIIIRQVKPEDVHDVSSIAYNSFRFSRFHMDPYLDNEKANLLLKTSAENSILRGFVDIMYVAEVKNKVVGYYSGKKNYIKEFKKTFGTAVITAVDSDFHGMGIFTQLDNHLLDWFALNCDFAEMGTYLGNFPVHKTWISKNLSLIRGTYQFSKLINYC